MVVFGFVSKFSECSKIPSRADPRPLCCSQSTDSAASACPCASHSLSLCLSSGGHSFILFSLLYLHFLEQHPVTYAPSMSSWLVAVLRCLLGQGLRRAADTRLWVPDMSSTQAASTCPSFRNSCRTALGLGGWGGRGLLYANWTPSCFGVRLDKAKEQLLGDAGACFACVVLHHHAILHHNTVCFLKGRK